MALAYTAPTWSDGSGVGISASQLQALSDCMEGLVQGSDKAITNIAISGQTITLTFADGSQETGTSSGLKGISSIAKTGTSGLVDTYTITFTDGTTSTFTVTNGAQGSQGPAGPQGPQGPTGADGEDGVSPEVSISTITGGHRVTITDADHPSGQSFDVMDGQSGASDWDDITNKPFDDVSDDPGDGLYIQNDTLKAYANQQVNIHDNTSSAAAANRAKWELITLNTMGAQGDDYVLPGSWYMQQSITLSASQDTVATFNGYTIDYEGNEQYYINSGMALKVWTGTDDDDTRDYPYKSLEIDGINHECNITFPPYTGAGNPPTIIVKITQ